MANKKDQSKKEERTNDLADQIIRECVEFEKNIKPLMKKIKSSKKKGNK